MELALTDGSLLVTAGGGVWDGDGSGVFDGAGGGVDALGAGGGADADGAGLLLGLGLGDDGDVALLQAKSVAAIRTAIRIANAFFMNILLLFCA